MFEIPKLTWSRRQALFDHSQFDRFVQYGTERRRFRWMMDHYVLANLLSETQVDKYNALVDRRIRAVH